MTVRKKLSIQSMDLFLIDFIDTLGGRCLFFKDDESHAFTFSRLSVLNDRDPVQEQNNYAI